MGNPRFLVTRSPNGRGLAPIGTGQHQICLVRPFLRPKAIFFWVLWAPYTGRLQPRSARVLPLPRTAVERAAATETRWGFVFSILLVVNNMECFPSRHSSQHSHHSDPHSSA